MSALEIRVFSPDGKTLTGWIRQPIAAAFSDEFNGPGSGEISVPLDGEDAQLLQRDAVVRCYYQGKCVFAWIVEVLDRTLVDSSDRRTLRASGRGLLAWLEDAVIYPQGGFLSYANPDRQFNFAADDGTWMKSADYRKPVGVKWRDDKGLRKGQPKKWPDPLAEWIWITDPTKPVDAGDTGWFRSTFTLSKAERVRFCATADNRYEIFLDGAPLMLSPASSTDRITWAAYAKKTMRVPAGRHTIAARVQNEKPLRVFGAKADAAKDEIGVGGLAVGMRVRLSEIDKGDSGLKAGEYWVVKADADSCQISSKEGGAAISWAKDTECDLTVISDNSAGFLLTASIMGDDNRPGQVVERTSAEGWLAASEEPRWIPAIILWTLIREAQQRGVSRLDSISRSFTDALDSSGKAWATENDAAIPVGTDLLNVLDFTVDLGIDWGIDPESMRLQAWEQRGQDLSATVRLNIGRELLGYQTSEERSLKTAALVRTKDGWTESRNNVATYGRRETLIQVDRTRSEKTGATIARKMLQRLGKRRVVAQKVDVRATPEANPYFTFGVGDIIGVPSPTGRGSSRVRVLSLSMQTDGEASTYAVELEVLDV